MPINNWLFRHWWWCPDWMTVLYAILCIVHLLKWMGGGQRTLRVLTRGPSDSIGTLTSAIVSDIILTLQIESESSGILTWESFSIRMIWVILGGYRIHIDMCITKETICLLVKVYMVRSVEKLDMLWKSVLNHIRYVYGSQIS